MRPSQSIRNSGCAGAARSNSRWTDVRSAPPPPARRGSAAAGPDAGAPGAPPPFPPRRICDGSKSAQSGAGWTKRSKRPAPRSTSGRCTRRRGARRSDRARSESPELACAHSSASTIWPPRVRSPRRRLACRGRRLWADGSRLRRGSRMSECCQSRAMTGAKSRRSLRVLRAPADRGRPAIVGRRSRVDLWARPARR